VSYSQPSTYININIGILWLKVLKNPTSGLDEYKIGDTERNNGNSGLLSFDIMALFFSGFHLSFN